MMIWAGEGTCRKTKLKKCARQRENWREENVKSGVGNQEEVLIGIQEFNKKEARKPFRSP